MTYSYAGSTLLNTYNVNGENYIFNFFKCEVSTLNSNTEMSHNYARRHKDKSFKLPSL